LLLKATAAEVSSAVEHRHDTILNRRNGMVISGNQTAFDFRDRSIDRSLQRPVSLSSWKEDEFELEEDSKEGGTPECAGGKTTLRFPSKRKGW
jgi:hypothetical protein